jgi:hypothetical protein
VVVDVGLDKIFWAFDAVADQLEAGQLTQDGPLDHGDVGQEHDQWRSQSGHCSGANVIKPLGEFGPMTMCNKRLVDMARSAS